MSRERPILFSAPMVQAIRGGRKTQTRRTVKGLAFKPDAVRAVDDARGGWYFTRGRDVQVQRIQCPYGVPGDVLWVKETHRFDIAYDTLKPRDIDSHAAIWYEADGEVMGGGVPGKTRVSLHMQRRFSRIELTIKDVRVERLNDISHDDARAEGLEWVPPTFGIGGIPESWSQNPVDAYARLWEHINGPGSWDKNPWVWVVEFDA